METTSLFSRFENALEANRQKRIVAMAVLALVFVAMQLFMSPSLRGSDQFWYVGDVERVVLQDGLFRTNSIFPNSMPEDAADLPRFWVQNKPVSYLVLPLVYLTRNGHVAWLLFNMICLFSAAFFVGRVLQISKRKWFYFVALFVFFPFNFYLATQALPEIFIMFLIAAIHYLLLVPPMNFKKNILLALITAVLICQRPNYILLLPLIPVLFYFMHRKKSLVLGFSFLLVAVAASFMVMLFGEHLVKAPSIIDTIINNDHATSNMGNFFDDYDHSKVSWGDMVPLVFHKLDGAMQTQFAISGMSSLMFYLINVMLLSIPILFIQRKMNSQKHLVCLAFIAIHFMTVILFYNQYRYAASIIPSLFILCISMLRGAKWPFLRSTPFQIIVLSGCLAISAIIGMQVRKQAAADGAMIAELRTLEKARNFPALMCTWNNGAGLGVGYAVSPKNIYFFPPDMPLEEWFETARKIHTHSGIINPKASLYQKLKPFVIYEQVLEHTGMTYFEVGPQKLK